MKDNDVIIITIIKFIIKNYSDILIGTNGLSMGALISQQHYLIKTYRWPTIILYSEVSNCVH